MVIAMCCRSWSWSLETPENRSE